MANQLDIGKFLEQRRAEGEQESEGGFTVSHSNAARKLAKFALPRPYAWVSKFVQAAVVWDCRELRVRQDRSTTQFQFLTDHLSSLPTEQELVACMLSGKVGGDLPIEHFSVGLRALVEQTKLSFLLVIDDGEVEPKPVYAGQYFGEISERERLSKRYRSGPGITLTVAHIPSTDNDSRWLMGKKYEIRIIKELDEHCFLSPIPIEVDGRRVDGLLRSALHGPSDRYRPLFVSGAVEARYSPVQMALPESFEEKRLSVFSHPRRILRTYQGRKEFSSVFLAGLHLSRLISKDWPPAKSFSLIHWIRHGVLVDSMNLPVRTHGLGCQVFINADGLRTDLTGFQMVESHEKSDRETEAVRTVGEMLSSNNLASFCFTEDLDRESSRDREQDLAEASKKRIKILLKGSGTGLFLTLLNPPIGVPTTLGSIVAAYLPRDNMMANRLRKHLDTFKAIIESDHKSLVQTLKTWTSLPPGE